MTKAERAAAIDRIRKALEEHWEAAAWMGYLFFRPPGWRSPNAADR